MSISTHCPCNVDIRVFPHHILPSFADTNRMPVQPGRVFVFVRCMAVHKHRDIRQLMEEVLPMEVHRVVALEAVQASSHDLLSRRAEEAADEYRWAEAVALDSHDAACSPQGEDNMKVRGDGYSQDDREVAELLGGT